MTIHYQLAISNGASNGQFIFPLAIIYLPLSITH